MEEAKVLALQAEVSHGIPCLAAVRERTGGDVSPGVARHDDVRQIHHGRSGVGREWGSKLAPASRWLLVHGRLLVRSGLLVR